MANEDDAGHVKYIPMAAGSSAFYSSEYVNSRES